MESEGHMPRTCSATRKDGRPCQAPVFDSDATECFAHAPGRASERAEARRRGGAGRSSIARLERRRSVRLGTVLSRLESALDGVESGKLTPAQGGAIAALSRALVAVYEISELEGRLATLEAQQPEGWTGRAAW